jgi:hypothetical protein
MEVDTPIEYPIIEVPGHGLHKVKFGLRAQYLLEKQYGIPPEEFGKRFKEWLPRKEEDGTITPGHASLTFVFDVLAACLAADGLNMSPEALADCFEYSQIAVVARAIVEAFTKTRWSAQTPAPELATSPEPTTRPN